MPMPTNRFCGAMPEDQTGQPYTFSDYLDDAREALIEAEKMYMHLQAQHQARRRIMDVLGNAESLIEQARRLVR